MASTNRSRYFIEIGDGWKRFSKPLPGFNMLGTVKAGLAEGALVRRVVDGDYLLVRPGKVVTLLLRKVEAAIDAKRAA